MGARELGGRWIFLLAIAAASPGCVSSGRAAPIAPARAGAIADRAVEASGVGRGTSCGSQRGAAGPAPGPAPVVELVGAADDAFTFRSARLPAVSPDGRLVAVGVVAEDGARGDPNFRLVVRDVDTDQVMEEIIVLEPGPLPPSVASGGETMRAFVDDGLVRVNAYLAGAPWIPLAEGASPLSAPACRGREADLVAGGLRVRYEAPRLIVADERGVVLERDVSSWSARPSPAVARRGCSNPGYLSEVRVDRGRRTLFVTTSYCGTDACWEPDSASHVVRLP